MYSLATTSSYAQFVLANTYLSQNGTSKKRDNLSPYRNADIFGEVTLELHLDDKPLGEDRLAAYNLQVRSSRADFLYLLAEIMVKAGIISLCDVFKAQSVARSSDARASFALIVHKVSDRTLTLAQAAVAVNHIHLTDSSLFEALALVSTKAPPISANIIDFLKQVGLLSEEKINNANLKQSLEPNYLAVCLVAANVIDSDTLRNAIRLRYLLNKGELNFEQAKKALQFCTTKGIDAEEYLSLYVR